MFPVFFSTKYQKQIGADGTNIGGGGARRNVEAILFFGISKPTRRNSQGMKGGVVGFAAGGPHLCTVKDVYHMTSYMRGSRIGN